MREARDQAWQEMMEKFPLPEPATPPPEIIIKEPERNPTEHWETDAFDSQPPQVDGQKMDMVDDILWVYHNLVRKGVQPSECPSPGTWGLLCFAKENKSRFFEAMWPKAMSVLAAREASKEKTPEEILEETPPTDEAYEEIKRLMG